MTSPYDVLVVGAGPAGLAAAASAAASGARVAVLDRGLRPGGQYWRHGAESAQSWPRSGRRRGVSRRSGAKLQHHWAEFARLRDELADRGVEILTAHHVQTLVRDDGEWVVRCLVGAEPRLSTSVVELRSRGLVLATGAYDRQLPFAGWDLPGVYTAGGAQALLKEHGVRVGDRVVVAGTGPFLLPVADGLLRSGAQVPLIAEANTPFGFAAHPGALLGATAQLGEAAAYAARLARDRVPYRRRHLVVRAVGADRLEAVEIVRLDRQGRPVVGSLRSVACDALAVGWGFTPQLELQLQAGCATRIDVDGSLVVTVDDRQRTSAPGVWAAGEATGVGGWDLSAVEGRIAGAAAAGADVDPRWLRRRAHRRRFAAAMHAVHPVPGYLIGSLPDDTLVCRCEEVPAEAIRSAVTELAATDTRTVKLLARPGMGWCQGRICGYGTALLTARACARTVTEPDLRAMAERPLAAPSTLATLAGDPEDRR